MPDDLTGPFSDLAARVKRLEGLKSQAPAQTSSLSGKTRLYYLPTSKLLFSGTTTAVTSWTRARASDYLPASCSAVLLQVHTRSGDDAILVYLSPDQVAYSYVGSADRSTGDEVDVWEHAIVPLGSENDFYYKVVGDPGTTNWKAFDVYLVGYWD